MDIPMNSVPFLENEIVPNKAIADGDFEISVDGQSQS